MSRSVFGLLVVASLGVSAAPVDDAALAIQRTLSWEKKWFGTHFGERCVRREAGGKKFEVRVRMTSQKRQVGMQCDTGSPIVLDANAFAAYAPKSALFFSGQTQPYAVGQLVDGEDRSDCRVTEDDLLASVRRGGQKTTVSFAQQGSPAVLSGFEIENFLSRTIAFHASRVGLPPPTQFRLGELHSGDPFAIVAIEQLDEPLFVEIPGVPQLQDRNFCGLVFNAGRFMGRSPRNETTDQGSMDSLLTRLKDRSTTVTPR